MRKTKDEYELSGLYNATAADQLDWYFSTDPCHLKPTNINSIYITAKPCSKP